jgi:hypothetical protein
VTAEVNPRVGLCATCSHARVVRSGKETRSEFWLCERSASDPRYAKYPALPVRFCPGYELRSASSRD